MEAYGAVSMRLWRCMGVYGILCSRVDYHAYLWNLCSGMDSYGRVWRFMGYYAAVWCNMQIYGALWMVMDGYGGAWGFMEYHAAALITMRTYGILWSERFGNIRKPCCAPCGPMESYGVVWMAMDVYG